MRNKTERRKTSLFVRLLNLLIVLATVFLAISAFWMSSQLRDAYVRDKYDLIASYAKQGDYYEMIRCYHGSNNYDVEPFETEFDNCYRVAEYAECAFLKSVAVFRGDEAAAQRLEERMKQAAAGASGLEGMIDEVDALIQEKIKE